MAVEHQKDIAELRSQIATLKEEAGKKLQAVGWIDKKSMVPGLFGGDKKSTAFREWSFKMREYVRGFAPHVSLAMERMERRQEPIKEDELSSFGLSKKDDENLRALIISRTTEDALAQVRAPHVKGGLEMWRVLEEEYDPRSEQHAAILQQRLILAGVAMADGHVRS